MKHDLAGWIVRCCAVSAVLCSPALRSPALAGFKDVSEAWGFDAGNQAAFADYNGDGFVDVLAGGNLYRNEGGERFVRVTAEAGGPEGGGGIWGDYNNDGRVDLFSYNGKGTLYRGKADGTFAKAAFPELPTISSQGAVWGDFNHDGRLDLYVGGYEAWQEAVYPDARYQGEADGTFTEVWRSPSNAHYSARGITSADVDEDGDTDIYVSHYRLQPNILWRNDGSGGFENVAEDVGAHGIPDKVIEYTGGISYPICGHTISSAFGDLDNDGHIDLFVGNFSHPPEDQDRPQFLRNLGPEGDFKFEDRSEGAGLAWQESFASPALGDYDNDGDLDLYFTTVYGTGSYGIKNYPVLYRNDGGWKFVDVTAEEGVAELPATYQAAWADIDNDGDLDLCTAGKMFLNEGRDHHWIVLELSGDGATVNKSAIGAQARIRFGDRVLTREVEGGTGQGNQNALALHFGLGSHGEPVDVEIAWPGGTKQVVEGLAPGRRHQITFTR